MKFNWKEMNPSQKRETIVLFVLTAIALVFAILDLSGKWPNNLCYITLAVLSVFEGVFSWNKNRKMAILEFVAAAFFAANTFM